VRLYIVVQQSIIVTTVNVALVCSSRHSIHHCDWITMRKLRYCCVVKAAMCCGWQTSLRHVACCTQWTLDSVDKRSRRYGVLRSV